MKKLILITLTLVLICSASVAAETDVAFDFGAVQGPNIESDVIPGGKVRLTTDQYNYKRLYDLIEVTSTFGIDDPNYNFVSSDLIFYSQLDQLISEDDYVGIGLKQLFLDNSQAATDYFFTSDIEAYGVPVALKLEEDYGFYKVYATGSIFKGIYTATMPGEDAAGNCSGISIDLGVKLQFSAFDLTMSYKQEDYSFNKDSNINISEDFTDDYQGLFLGINF